jgi:hypothetical protein
MTPRRSRWSGLVQAHGAIYQFMLMVFATRGRTSRGRSGDFR